MFGKVDFDYEFVYVVVEVVDEIGDYVVFFRFRFLVSDLLG